MANINLIDKLKCLRSVSLSNFSLRSVFNTIQTKISDTYKAVATAAGKFVEGTIKGTIESATDAFNAVVSTAKAGYAKAEALLKQVQDLSGAFNTTCADAEKNDPQNPATNTVAETLSLPSSNNSDINNVSADTKNKKALEDAKSKTESTALYEMAQVIGKIDQQLKDKGIFETREYVRTLKNQHPLIDAYSSKLQFFQSVSENIGASYLAYTPDKPSLQLEQWKGTIPISIRRNVSPKMRADVFGEIENAYYNLNIKFVNNISNEFFTERKTIAFNVAHTYHIAGDSLWYTDHILTNSGSTLLQDLGIILTQVLGQQVVLINYLMPITPDIAIQNDVYTIEVENNQVQVDKRGNIVRPPFTNIDNNALMPVPPPEV